MSWRLRDFVGTDLTCYLQAGRAYATGDWERAISAYWSPLLSWLTAPAGALGIPAHRLAHLWGAVGLAGKAAAGRGLASTLGAGPGPAGLVALLVALSGARHVHRASDQLQGAFLLGALLLLIRGRHLGSGLLAGSAYLAKAAALPVFLLVLGATTPGRPPGERGRRFGAALLGLALVAGPWIGLLTWRAGHPTIGSAGAVNVRAFGPAWEPEYHPYFQATRLWPPAPGRLHAWEDPADHGYPPLSRLLSGPGLAAWARRAAGGVGHALTTLSGPETDALFLRLLALVLVAGACRSPDPARRRGARLIAAGVVANVAVYLPVINDSDRYYWFARDLATLAAVWLVPAAAARWPRGRRLATLVLVVSMGLTEGIQLGVFLTGPRPGAATRALAEGIEAAGLRPPLAASRHPGLVLAYHLDGPYQGVADASSREALAADLERAGPRTLVVWESDPLAPVAAGAPFLDEVMTGPGEQGETIRVYRVLRDAR